MKNKFLTLKKQLEINKFTIYIREINKFQFLKKCNTKIKSISFLLKLLQIKEMQIFPVDKHLDSIQQTLPNSQNFKETFRN